MSLIVLRNYLLHIFHVNSIIKLKNQIVQWQTKNWRSIHRERDMPNFNDEKKNIGILNSINIRRWWGCKDLKISASLLINTEVDTYLSIWAEVKLFGQVAPLLISSQ
jgi:hypothetical protein